MKSLHYEYLPIILFTHIPEDIILNDLIFFHWLIVIDLLYDLFLIASQVLLVAYLVLVQKRQKVVVWKDLRSLLLQVNQTALYHHCRSVDLLVVWGSRMLRHRGGAIRRGWARRKGRVKGRSGQARGTIGELVAGLTAIVLMGPLPSPFQSLAIPSPTAPIPHFPNKSLLPALLLKEQEHVIIILLDWHLLIIVVNLL